MRADLGVLCDYATVREGLLTVVGAGISILNRPAYPSPFGGMLALLLNLDPESRGTEHSVTVKLRRDREVIADVTGTFTVGPPSGETGHPPRAPLVADLRQLIIPEAGEYEITVAVDRRALRRFPVTARIHTPPEPGAQT